MVHEARSQPIFISFLFKSVGICKGTPTTVQYSKFCNHLAEEEPAGSITLIVNVYCCCVVPCHFLVVWWFGF